MLPDREPCTCTAQHKPCAACRAYGAPKRLGPPPPRPGRRRGARGRFMAAVEAAIAAQEQERAEDGDAV
jgi:hypothetical protein